ncbi:MAG: DUF2177 family protein [Ideonella sp.]
MNATLRLGWRPILIAYAACLLGLAVLDAIWLGIVAADFYQTRIGHLMATTPRLDAALAFYLIYPAAIVLFAVKPAIEGDNASSAWRLGAAFGFFAYATYDLSNLASLRDWPVLVSAVDMVWGTVLSATTAWLGHRAARAAMARYP